MVVSVLIENSAVGGYKKEWGLSFYVESEGRKYLVDMGASALFLKNAAKMNKNIDAVDMALLSHAHYDHANGIDAFFENNDKAKLYIASETGENCFGKKFIFKKYIGIPKGCLEKYKDRIVKCKDFTEVYPEQVYTVPHYKQSKDATKGMLIRNPYGKMEVDTFRHEQSIVFVVSEENREKKLVVFSCCSHLGVPTIIDEIRESFPDMKIKAFIGGFHLFGKNDQELLKIAREIAKKDVEQFYTGHCTGDRGVAVLQQVMGDRVKPLSSGMSLFL